MDRPILNIIVLPTLFILVITVGLFFFSSGNVYDVPSPHQKTLHAMLNRFINHVEKNFDLELSAFGGSNEDHKTACIGVGFTSRTKKSKDECRKLIIEITDIFLFYINDDKELAKYLLHNPFTFKDINLDIFIIPLNKNVVDPDIGIASLLGGEIVYKTDDPNNEFRYKSRIIESYEEALQKVKESSQN